MSLSLLLPPPHTPCRQGSRQTVCHRTQTLSSCCGKELSRPCPEKFHSSAIPHLFSLSAQLEEWELLTLLYQAWTVLSQNLPFFNKNTSVLIKGVISCFLGRLRLSSVRLSKTFEEQKLLNLGKPEFQVNHTKKWDGFFGLYRGLSLTD